MGTKRGTTKEQRPDPHSPEEIGRRLQALRIAKGYRDNMTAFARIVGMTQPAWSNYEVGIRVPRLNQLAKLRAAFRSVTADFILFGDMTQLEKPLADEISKLLSGGNGDHTSGVVVAAVRKRSSQRA